MGGQGTGCVTVAVRGQEFPAGFHTENRRIRFVLFNPFQKPGQAVAKKGGRAEIKGPVSWGKGLNRPFPLGYGINSG
jgi:hypothetical protein